MKQLVLVMVGVMCICYTTQTFAQVADTETVFKEKNIILDDKNNESETSIEIKNGQLFVDGKKISDLDKNTKIKIVKKNTISDKHSFNFNQENMDSPFRPQRKTFGTIDRKAMLGVQTTDANPGAEVNDVVAGSAAEKAGLKKGDIIIAVDGDNIRTSNDLAKKIISHKKGDEIKIQIERNGKASNLLAQLDAPKLDKIPFNNAPGTGRFSLPFGNFEELFSLDQNDSSDIGMQRAFDNIPEMSLEDFFGTNSIRVKRANAHTPKIGLELEESIDGLEVSDVQPNSAAAKAGIKKGDKIKTIEGEEVQSLDQAKREIIRNQNNKKLYFGVQRAGTMKTLPVVLPQAKRRAQF